MLGPAADLETVSQIFALQADGGLVASPGIVDFVQGSGMAGGVFITVRVEDPRLRADLEYLKVGRGYYYTFFRPYHLWFIEAPLSVARAYLHRYVTLAPLDEPAAEVLTIAKRALRPGETLDTFGGYTFYGQIERAAAARDVNALPVGLAPGAVIKNPLAEGQVITWHDVQLDESRTVVRLRREQDPVDVLIQSVIKTGRVLIVHEAAKTGGYGGELAAVIAGSEAFDYLEAPILRLAGRDMPIPYNRTLEYHTVPQVEDILAAARRLAGGEV